MYDGITEFPETDDDFAPLPECGEWTRGETCDDSLCPAHGAEVQANLRATASQSWVGVIALAREIVRTQDVAERYARGEVPPVEPLEPGDLAHSLAALWRAPRQAGDLWSDFAEGLLLGLGWDDGFPHDEVAPLPCWSSAWRKGREWALAWVRHGRGACDSCYRGWVAGSLYMCIPCSRGRYGDDPRRWQPDPARLPWAQPVCRDSAQRCRYQRESARLSKLARPWEPAGDVVSADGRVTRALDPVELYP